MWCGSVLVSLDSLLDFPGFLVFGVDANYETSYDYRVCYNNATRLWVDQTGIDDMTGLRTYYGVRDS